MSIKDSIVFNSHGSNFTSHGSNLTQTTLKLLENIAQMLLLDEKNNILICLGVSLLSDAGTLKAL